MALKICKIILQSIKQNALKILLSLSVKGLQKFFNFQKCTDMFFSKRSPEGHQFDLDKKAPQQSRLYYKQ